MKVAIVSCWGDEVTTTEKKKYGVRYALRKPADSKKIEDLICKVMQIKQKKLHY